MAADGEGAAWVEGFYFQQRQGRLDVRRVARLDLQRVVEAVDVSALQAVLENVAFCDLRERDLQGMPDAVVVKAFRVAQLIIEYLLNLENSLFRRADEAESEAVQARNESEVLRDDNRLIADENDALRKELRQKRKALATLEYVLSVHGPGGAAALKGAGGAHPLQAAVCGECGKAFSSREFLRRHCSRRGHALHGAREGDGDENRAPNGQADDAEARRREAMAETAAAQQRIVAVAVEEARQAERDLHQTQLRALREDADAHARKVEELFKARLAEQQADYEKRIAALEAKLAVFQTLQLSERGGLERLGRLEQALQSRNLPSPAHTTPQRRVGVDRAVGVDYHTQDEILSDLASARAETDSSADGFAGESKEEQKQGESEVEALPEARPPKAQDLLQLLHQERAQRRGLALRGLATSVTGVLRVRNTRAKGRAFAHWKLSTLRSVLKQTSRAISEGRITMPVDPSKRAAVEHVARFAGDGDHEPVSDDFVQNLAMRFLHARKEQAITDEERLGMDQVEAMLGTRASFVEGQFKIQRQTMNHMPLPEKPYVRARWDHRPAEVRAQIELIEGQLRTKMAGFDASLPEQSRLSDAQFGGLMNQLRVSREAITDTRLRKAIKAVHGLANELTDEYWPRQDVHFDSDLDLPPPAPRDALLREALVPVSERVVSRVDTYSPRSSVGSAASSEDESEYEEVDPLAASRAAASTASQESARYIEHQDDVAMQGAPRTRVQVGAPLPAPLLPNVITSMRPSQAQQHDAVGPLLDASPLPPPPDLAAPPYDDGEQEGEPTPPSDGSFTFDGEEGPLHQRMLRAGVLVSPNQALPPVPPKEVETALAAGQQKQAEAVSPPVPPKGEPIEDAFRADEAREDTSPLRIDVPPYREEPAPTSAAVSEQPIKPQEASPIELDVPDRPYVAARDELDAEEVEEDDIEATQAEEDASPENEGWHEHAPSSAPLSPLQSPVVPPRPFSPDQVAAAALQHRLQHVEPPQQPAPLSTIDRDAVALGSSAEPASVPSPSPPASVSSPSQPAPVPSPSQPASVPSPSQPASVPSSPQPAPVPSPPQQEQGSSPSSELAGDFSRAPFSPQQVAAAALEHQPEHVEEPQDVSHSQSPTPASPHQDDDPFEAPALEPQSPLHSAAAAAAADDDDDDDVQMEDTPPEVRHTEPAQGQIEDEEEEEEEEAKAPASASSLASPPAAAAIPRDASDQERPPADGEEQPPTPTPTPPPFVPLVSAAVARTTLLEGADAALSEDTWDMVFDMPEGSSSS